MKEQNNTQQDTSQNVNEIDLVALFKKLFDKRKKLYKAIGIGVIIGLVIAFSLPKQYQVEVTLSPESGTSGSGNMAGIASMLGMGGMGGLGEDALNVSMFPEIVKTTPFLLEMLETPLQTKEEETMILYDYLDTQKRPWWSHIMGLPGQAIGGIMSLFRDKTEETDSIQKIDPFQLTQEQSGRIGMLKKILNAETDSKTSMTKVSITLQDPVAAALVADSAVVKLQRYITDYRTRKAQEDYNYLTKVAKETEQDYIKAQQRYSQFMDANRNVNLQSMKAEGERLQNAAMTAYQIYSQMETQRQLARAKVQEAKPVFAVVEPATVPLFPSSPKKMMILVVFVFLAVVVESAWILFGEDLWKSVKAEMKKPKE